MKIKAVIFDMDGLMFDTENLTYKLHKRIFENTDINYTLDWYKSTIGKRFVDIEGMFLKLCGEDFDYDAFRNECRRVYREYTDEHGVPIKKGLFELLEYLKESEIKIALATSTSTASATRTLEISDTLKYFDALVCAEDVTNGKPHPEPFKKAAEKLGVAPDECLALEDSFNGIRSAHAAGTVAVMVPDLIEPTDEIRALCYKVCADLNEVIEVVNSNTEYP